MEIDSILQPFQRFGVHLGLERIEKLLANLGNPHQSVPVIHVAGTNGKGSVCAYLCAVLTEAGYRVGRYTSPHLIDWNERICLNEQAISLETLRELLLQVQAAIQPDEESPTQFEVITAAAWLYFYQQEVDVAVVEVGLGGRLDATNVCANPLVTIITSISREHWQVLGPTLADIAREKAGILKPGCPAVIGQLPEEAIAVVKQRIVELGCPAVFPQAAVELGTAEAQSKERWVEYRDIENLEFNPKSGSPVQNPKSIKYPLPLLGDFQLQNSALAIASFQILCSQGWKITEQAIASGMGKTKWLGRLQWTTWKNRQLLIDGAHNPAAAIALRQYVDTLEKSPIHWVMGMLSTKDHADIFKALLREGEKLYLVPVPDHTSAETESLATLAQNICPQLGDCRIYPELTDCLEAATAIATPDDLIVLCGSLYLIGHFLKHAK
ncbi:bifunctional folylpolyglutamate synthase/dihydrofolate synthase [Funiculus sociatus GB2-A5]|uniref:tetrahydrofolate synthase n=1 Tax=Funiculus sociatus GB2-A5 TaxID=2933946 RepID=A0ABV0JR70_9CYAN|nr:MULTISPECIES: folylpolyglutamate synthase/dihydrofolate synthase family protein [unclassified Trichocoleus]MBD1906180.1 bifunctional folylpolyglutamate synthase/dihydrofolate synthase [Trichocoleus sp. FACHB-832]MBD2061199.1 bifunctional folylpolyglutamate synthase/dihydrofolate synthase [Trichocoleus sp. FACHB-6]